ncbi:MAG: DNA mismatch repair protein MutS [Chlamydiia bacterium]|nr:DNA mismatch repair protein MutS [Chlamydiia bacterium]
MTDTISTTPMMKQWHDCKKEAGSALLLFRLGDFYESFNEDAEILANTLMITLTKRQEIQMAGIPVRSIDGYLEKLIDHGLSVAIAEQTQNPKDVKGIVGRKVTRVLTPATFTSSKDQNSGSNNFLLAISHLNKSYSISYTDTSTSEFFFSSFTDSESMINEIERINPKEILIDSKLKDKTLPFLKTIESQINAQLISVDSFYFDHKMCIDKLHKHLKVASLDGFGLKGETSSINACGALFFYLENEIFFDTSSISSIKKRDTAKFLRLDHAALSHLEIFSSTSGSSLFEVMNYTKTAMGERLLKNSLLYPLINSDAIKKRQSFIKELLEQDVDLSKDLKGIKDIERLMTKIGSGRANPADLFFLSSSLDKIPGIIKTLSNTLSIMTKSFSPLDLVSTILNTLAISESEYFIAQGVNEELDHLKALEKNSTALLKNYEDRCKENLGIKTLKIGHSRSFGYYLEVSNKSKHLVPNSFIRKQTLVNGERYITDELQELESKILSAKEQALSLEQKIFVDLVNLCIDHQKEIFEQAKLIAKIDLVHSLKTKALSRGYICPEVNEGFDIEIEQGAHPTLLQMMKKEAFIPNNISLTSDKFLSILTGPNMAGKSTYIKSVAQLSILAQIGSFIPAKSAKLGIVDKIFTRIGAFDDLQRGQSTFMVEMTETANILRNATKRSLIILDEIGRGTSTYDGIALAKSIATYISSDVKAKTLFATHYLELTDLSQSLENIKNIRSTVLEEGEKITFLHKIEEGKADQSYGVFVGELAGLPRRVILEAKENLKNLSLDEDQSSVVKKAKTVQYDMFTEEEKHPIILDLESTDVDHLTPFEALEKLNQWKKSL